MGHAMNPQEFETEARDRLEQTLTQLQTAILTVAQLETQIAQMGRIVYDLSQIIESYLHPE
jgi:hypothetical protein